MSIELSAPDKSTKPCAVIVDDNAVQRRVARAAIEHFGIVHDYRGRVDVESALGSGTTFHITVPVRQPLTDTAAMVPT